MVSTPWKQRKGTPELRITKPLNKEAPTRPTHATPAAVTAHPPAHHALARALGRKPFRRPVPVREPLDMLLLMAATTRTIFAVTRRYFSFGHETGRRAIRHDRGASTP